MMKDIAPHLRKLPESPGVYLIKDTNEVVIFISKSENIRKEVFSIITNKNSKRNIVIQKNIGSIDFEVINDNLAATKRELGLIKQYHPPLNGRKKGEKQYRFITLTMEEDFPRARKSKTAYNSNLKYLGPFPKSRHVQRVLSIAANFFQIADCGKKIVLGNDHKIVETCIRRQTKQCMRPCEVDVDKSEYDKAVQGFIRFFQKEETRVQDMLTTQMKKAVESKEFEKAAKIRDDLQSISMILK